MIADKTIRLIEQQIKENFQNIKDINEFCRKTCEKKGHDFLIKRNREGYLIQKCKHCNFSKLILKPT